MLWSVGKVRTNVCLFENRMINKAYPARVNQTILQNVYGCSWQLQEGEYRSTQCRTTSDIPRQKFATNNIINRCAREY